MKEPNSSFCGTADHDISRRAFLGTMATGLSGLIGSVGAVHAFDQQSITQVLKGKRKNVILLWLAGGPSQFETWDPKPGRPTGGPFAEIPTTVPGVRISELLPKMAKRMHHVCLIRSLNTRLADHGGGARLMMRGRRNEPSLDYPDLGAILAKELSRANTRVPDYVNFYSSTEGRNSARLSPAFLGAQYGPMQLTEGMVPPNLKRLKGISEFDHRDRAALQGLLSHRFAAGRETQPLKSHAAAYARAQGLMSSEALFDLSREPVQVAEKYGPTLFGQQAMLARRMVEAGVPFVRVSRAWWDSHGQNFETHLELVSELDRVMSALLDDLKQRGLCESTLVVAMGEFGRTPKINPSLGRDHFARAWSMALFGCGIQGGACFGKTDADGQEVSEDEVGAGEIFATMLAAVGINPKKEYHVGPRPVPLVNPGIEPINPVLV